jgi:hypothetical protein
MYKSISAAVLLAASFAVISGIRHADALPTTSTSPLIVARGKLLNRSGAIPTTTIFTPAQTGLYRLSVYATVTQSDPNNGGSYGYSVNWTDDAGSEQGTGGAVLLWSANSVPPNAGAENPAGWQGNVLLFEAVAGTPVTHSLTGGPDNSLYSLYYTIERLQ